MALLALLFLCALGTFAEQAPPSRLETGLTLAASSGLEYRSRLRRGVLDLCLAAREDGLSLGLGLSGEGGRLVAGSLLPGAGLSLLLDPLGRGSGGEGALGRPDPALSSSLSGLLLEDGRLGAFILARRPPADSTEEAAFFEGEVEDPPPPLVLAGLSARLSLGGAGLGLVLGLARSPGGAEPSSWYDAPLPGSWPRFLASLSASWEGGGELSLLVSEALDRGHGLGFRFQGGGDQGPLDYHLSLFARSPSFLGAGEAGVLARARGEFGLPLFRHGRLEFQAELEAREAEGGPGVAASGAPELSRGLRLRLLSSSRRAGSPDPRCEIGIRSEAERRLLSFALGLGRGALAVELRGRAEWSRGSELPGSLLPEAEALNLLLLGADLGYRPREGARAGCRCLWESEALEAGWRPRLELRPAAELPLGGHCSLGFWVLLEVRGPPSPSGPLGLPGHPEPPEPGLEIAYRLPP